MKYRLKNKELQRKLDSFTDGEFSNNLRDEALVGKKFVAVICGEPVPGVDARISPDEPEERPARRLSFLFGKDEVEEIPARPSEVMKTEVLRRIESLRGSLSRIERSLEKDEPDEVDVRWGFAPTATSTASRTRPTKPASSRAYWCCATLKGKRTRTARPFLPHTRTSPQRARAQSTDAFLKTGLSSATISSS